VTKARQVGSTVVSEQGQEFLLEYLEIERRALLPTVDKQNVARQL
jgi:hypothetical protein